MLKKGYEAAMKGTVRLALTSEVKITDWRRFKL
jgi:hypothetical protein